jgi:hypothetical protein
MRGTLLIIMIVAVACGGSVEAGGTGGQVAGSGGGSAGVPNVGGSAGVPNAGGTTGVPGTGGSAGVPSAGGSAGVPGTGGSAGTGPCPDPNDPKVHYVSYDPDECKLIDVDCFDNAEYFESDCGCGCIDLVQAPPGCPDPNDPTVHYIGNSYEDPSACEVIDFACGGGQVAFSNEYCGCGCLDVPATACEGLGELECMVAAGCRGDYAGICNCDCGVTGYEASGCAECPPECFAFGGCSATTAIACPNPDDPRVRYFSHDPTFCSTVDWDGCGGWEVTFESLCGCGCIDTGLD